MLEYWYAALRSKYGIVLRTNLPQVLIQRLYKARAEAMDQALEGVSIVQSPTTYGELWLVKNGKASVGNPPGKDHS